LFCFVLLFILEAAFFLGKRVTVLSKTADSEWVASVEMSVDGLQESGKDWTTTIELREPRGKETRTKSFTAVKISDLNFRVTASVEEDLDVKKRMAHIYYYYTHSK
jgi:hypothetical protein